MTGDSKKTLGKVVQIDERRIQVRWCAVRSRRRSTACWRPKQTRCAGPSAASAARSGPTAAQAAMSASSKGVIGDHHYRGHLGCIQISNQVTECNKSSR